MRVKRPSGEVPFMIFSCDPWDEFLKQLEDDCERARLEYELEQDLDRERELYPEIDEVQPDYLDATCCDWIQVDPEEFDSDEIYS